MPWAVDGLRLGRDWVAAPDPATLRARWTALTGAEGAERERLFRPSRTRTPSSGAAALPGQRSATARFADAPGAFPDPVRVLRAPFDEQWLLPDQRLIDSARPELWRVRDAQQVFLLEAPGLLATAHLPAGRLGRIRPLHRRPGGAEPNLAPGLLALLGGRHGGWVTPEDVLCWILAAGRPGPRGYEVPLAADPERWRAGLELGHRLLTVQLRGARGGEPPRLPGGRRPYVRAAVTAWPAGLGYDAESETLTLGDGAVSPVPAEAWEYEVQGVRVLEAWFAARCAHRDPGAAGLEGLGPAEWPQSWTSELLALVTTLALLAALAPERAAFAPGPLLPAAELEAAGVLPPPRWSRRPASVLDHQEEGPGGQFALL
ncbi:DNA methyltransferase [Streptomyces katrae]|uniref:DNA methyltransferase n=1 Tax=Streptomyces katrae TaxID=68223 RepID=A0ABT7H8D2_9ACTN|nr:type ISP restriction/modification enzyme [Streptomyces katrae]MDK9501330.1 DNA methyltransferase [Streptomyces katrae]